MADYYPLIARAIAGLDKNTGEARRALYERARTALVAQLRGVNPPLEESEITRERLALEEAIRKVEAEAARRQRSDSLAPLRTGAFAPAAAATRAANPWRRATPSAHQVDGAAPQAVAPISASMRLRADIGKAPAPARLRQNRRRGRPPRPARAIRRAHATGRAAQAAARSVRRHSARRMISTGWEPRSRTRFDAETLRPRRRDVPLLEPMDEIEEPGPLPRPRPQRGDEDEQAGAAARAAFLYRHHQGADRGHADRGAGRVLLLAARDLHRPLSGFARPAGAGRARCARHQDAATAGRRSPIASGRRPTAARCAGVAQRVVLYEEEPNDPQGKRFVGSAVWRTESIPGSGNQPPELAMRADVEIPERRLTMRFSIRRNTDQALPASHTIEVMFNLPADFPAGGISNVPGILMKQAGADARHAAGRACGQGDQQFLPDRAFGGGIRHRAQHPAVEGARLVRHPGGLQQHPPRHSRDREGHARRARVCRSIRHLAAVIPRQVLGPTRRSSNSTRIERSIETNWRRARVNFAGREHPFLHQPHDCALRCRSLAASNPWSAILPPTWRRKKFFRRQFFDTGHCARGATAIMRRCVSRMAVA